MGRGLVILAVAFGIACNATSDCPDGLERCGDECVDVASDFRNCGACASPCGGSRTCSSGRCSGSGGGLSCPPEAPACTDEHGMGGGCCGGICYGTPDMVQC